MTKAQKRYIPSGAIIIKEKDGIVLYAVNFEDKRGNKLHYQKAIGPRCGEKVYSVYGHEYFKKE